MLNDRVRKTISDLEDFMAGRDDALAVPRDAGEFLYALALSKPAANAVEIGTSYGYSGLWIAAALAQTGGRLTTIDQSERKTQAARANFEAAGLLGCVELRTELAINALQAIEGPVDFVLNDADKENALAYIQALTPRLADRAVILTDNTRTHAAQLAPTLDWLAKQSHFFTIDLLGVGNGMALSVYCRPR